MIKKIFKVIFFEFGIFFTLPIFILLSTILIVYVKKYHLSVWFLCIAIITGVLYTIFLAYKFYKALADKKSDKDEISRFENENK